MNQISSLENVLVVPIYGNEESLHDLAKRLNRLNRQIPHGIAVTFVFDGIVDNSYLILCSLKETFTFPSKFIKLSRNFGAFSAIRMGLKSSNGQNLAVMSADLQEPEDLIIKLFAKLLEKEVDIVFGFRLKRNDGRLNDFASRIFWGIYRKLFFKEVPVGGIDVFAISRKVANAINPISDKNISLISLLLSIGFTKEFIGYERQSRISGYSRWTIKKRLRYALDSIYGSSGIPLILIQIIGAVGSLLGIGGACWLTYLRIVKEITVPGYTSLMVVIFLSTSLVLFSIGILGTYLWRVYENSRDVPYAIVEESFDSFARE